MLHFSFSTLYTSVFISILLLAVITLCFRNTKILVNVGYKLLALFLVLTFLRFLLPYELPFTVTLLLPQSVSWVLSWIQHPWPLFSGFEISIWNILQGIWLIGSVISLFRYVRIYRQTHLYITNHGKLVTTQEPYHALLDRICRERKKQNPFQVVELSGISTPMLYGLFTPRILVPAHMELSEEDWYYTLAHEISHHFHHDLFIKQLVQLLTIIYWWNPLCHVLKHQTDTILEMRVDDTITASDKHAIDAYLHCLLHIAEMVTDAATPLQETAIGFLPKREEELTLRFQMLINYDKKKRYFINVALFLLIGSLCVLSYLFIFEAYYVAPNATTNSIGQTAENSYAVLKEDGTYDIYFLDWFIENVDSLEYYDSSIPIYTEKEIANEKN